MKMFCIESYENLPIEGFTITHGWIFDCLQKNCNDFVLAKGDSKVLKLEIIDISDGKGYASKVFKSTVYFDDETKNQYEFILKIPVTECLTQLLDTNNKTDEGTMDMDDLGMAHNNECLFYSDVVKEIGSIKVPKCYGCCQQISNKQDGAILMELLSNKANCIPFYQSITLYQAKSVMKELMKLQVFSLTDGKHWKSKFKNIICREKTLKFLKYFYITYWEHIKKIMPKFMLEEIENESSILFSNSEEIMIYNNRDLVEEYKSHSVIAHCDLWSNNIMFSLDSKNRFMTDVDAIIDWQTTSENTIGSDIARLIVTGCSPETRREIEYLYLPEYFEELKKKVIDKGETFSISYETFKKIYNFCMIEQALGIAGFVGFKLSSINSNNEERHIWEARTFNLLSKVYFVLKDAICKAKILKPEWLEKNITDH